MTREFKMRRRSTNREGEGTVLSSEQCTNTVRCTNAPGLGDLKLMQADILELAEWTARFDVVVA